MEATAFKENPEAVEFQFYQIPTNKQSITTTSTPTPQHTEPTTTSKRQRTGPTISWLAIAVRTLNKAGVFMDANELIQRMFKENPEHRQTALKKYKGEGTAVVLIIKSLTEHCKKAGLRKGYVKQQLIMHGEKIGLVEWADAKFAPYPQFLNKRIVPSNGHKANTSHFAHAN